MERSARESARRYCLVAPNPICWNPRLVKEADALAAAGNEVRVVALAVGARETALDLAMASRRPWRLEQVDTDRHSARGAIRRGTCRVVERLAKRAFDARITAGSLRDHAASRFLIPLARRAAARPADVVIAHNLAALPAAARAARRLGARLGFDIEDLHSGELPDAPEHAPARTLVKAVEAHYLPRCDYLTAASPGIADAVVELYGVRRPVVVLNTFPAEERAPTGALHVDRVDSAPALYWFSQTVGPGRGIEEALEALGRMAIPARLYLRGNASESYRRQLLARATELGCADRVHLLAPVPPDELVARSSEHDVGLALEQPTTRNRDLCVTNKLFTYMLAGLAVAATDTNGQRTVLAGRDVGAFLYEPGDVCSLARRLDELLQSPERAAAAKRKALAAALTDFAWAHDARRLVSYLESDPGTVAVSSSSPSLVAAIR